MAAPPDQPRVVVVGAGTRFLSGLSHYTHQLAIALAGSARVSVVLMRQLIPTRLYPGRGRVGAGLADIRYPPAIPVYDGVDWYWFPSLLAALVRIARARPHVVVLQWWTAAVLHTYLVLALAARAVGARVVVEFHEVQDPSEERLAAARLWARLLARSVTGLADAFVVHSEYDREPLRERYGLGERPLAVIPHGPYAQYETDAGTHVHRPAPPGACNLLFFGIIRPYKGLEEAIRAFDALPDEVAERFWLTVVGETWERWTLPAELIASSRHRDRITFVNRYVSDPEASGYFSGADAVVLPYQRSSASGTLHVAMALGLPVITTRVGGLVEAAEGYGGAVLVEPGDLDGLTRAFHTVAAMRGQRFPDPHSWGRTNERYRALFRRLGAPA
jgi:glycosyltransferase involved in cell wall biosynthesis